MRLDDFRAPRGAPAPAPAKPAPIAVKKPPTRKLKPRMWVVDAMPRRKWLTAAQIAVICKVSRPEIHPHLFYARKVAAVEHRKDGECSCCGKPVVLWRRP